MTSNPTLTFAVIGKPNNGKSSIISALTFDNTIEVSSEIGTTKEANRYAYKYQDKEICYFYDTPGFEQAKAIYNLLDKNKNKPFTDFIQEHRDEKNYKKDIEIIEALLKSHFIIWVVNISEKYNKHTIGYELEIIKTLKQQKLVLLNQIEQDKDYTNEWKNVLEKEKFTTYSFDPLDSSFLNIKNLFDKIFENKIIKKDYRENLINIQNTYEKHYRENLDYSIKKITSMIAAILAYEEKETFYIKKDIDNLKIKLIQNFREEIYKLEKRDKKEIEKRWGYLEIEVKDRRKEFDAKMDLESSLLESLANILKKIIFIGLIPSKPSKKTAKCSFQKKDIDVSFTLLNRALSHLDQLINHGHANRKPLEIINDENNQKEWFSQEDKDTIAKIHRDLVSDRNPDNAKEELQNLLRNTVANKIIDLNKIS